jgi:hypothetical protein
MKTVTGLGIATVLSLGGVCAQADYGMWAGVEYLHWQEETSPIKVAEKGPLAAFGFNWTQEKPAGWLFAYRGKLYLGSVRYEGALLFSPSTPASGTTDYSGMEHEAQVKWRVAKENYNIDPLIGLGINTWNRELSANQKEMYTVLYVRTGVEFERAVPNGINGAVGVRYPLFTDENAYFNNSGYDNNPHLKPKGQLSAFANIGYRFTQELELTGYYESIKFDTSDPVSVNLNGTLFGHFYQPASTMNIFGLRLQYRFLTH